MGKDFVDEADLGGEVGAVDVQREEAADVACCGGLVCCGELGCRKDAIA